MSCAHGLAAEMFESAFSVDTSTITFGRGALAELGEHARALGIKRAAVFTDPRVKNLPFFQGATRSLETSHVDFEVFAQCRVEPTDVSFSTAAEFARAGRFDGYISIGGGSVIDTCKVAALYATYPAPFLTYVNAPIGEGRPVPGPLPPHIACPTTAGTGSETTAIAVCDILSIGAKTGIVSRAIRPTRALIDPTCTASLPASVVAAAGFDVLSHALESFTARPYSCRKKPDSPAQRPLSQGSNPWSDLGSIEALRLGGKYLVRAVTDPSDSEAREALSWAATLAGIAFGNAGVHLPHAMSYAVAGLAHDFQMPGYPEGESFVPHGISVILNAPSTFQETAAAAPDKHLTAARALGANAADSDRDNAGEILTNILTELMKKTGVPNGIAAVGLASSDLPALAERAALQKRLTDNAPIDVSVELLERLFSNSLTLW
ncbi:MAG: iron-containing alcohol dehydrogenase [Polyangiaceae bacterium]|nr:iron-containing alcohol dehydrogenase [Polyangiaceae bacterium]